ncbi:recombinase family protein [Paenibacillus anaericanus]|uniref:Recombinase family protein n=1 Tax=Paenibacillus anaericanus TaxID=170367 RepID=A0A433YG10_9BACL|nr:recombinase family protein [Paenibacillus anaericanus]
MKNKKRTRAYVRVSTLKDSQKDSPEHQEGLIRETVAKEGKEVDYVYLDRGTATTIMDRDDVKEMIQDAKNGEFNEIWFASLSRFSRDTLDSISLKRILVNALGIRLVSIEDMYDSAKEDNEMIFGIISSVNQKQSENISTSSKRGIRQSALKGNFTGSIPPFGYNKVEVEGRKTLEIISDQAEIIKSIFNMYIRKGMGEKAIVNYLNDPVHLIPSPKGGLWGVSTIQRILQNENYTGYLVSGKYEMKQFYDDIDDLQNRQKRLVARDPESYNRTSFQTHPEIISVEDFKLAQELRLVRGGGKRGGSRAFKNAFAKIMFCKDCGSAMVTMKGKSRDGGKEYRYLMCSKRRRQGEKGCINAKWMPYIPLRDQIIETAIKLMREKINMTSAQRDVESLYSFKENSYGKDIKKIENKIIENRKLLFELRRQHMLNELSDDQYEFEKGMYDKEITESESKLKSLNKKVDDHRDWTVLKNTLEEALVFLENQSNYDNAESIRNTLIKLIEKIDVDKNGRIEMHTVLG